MRRFAIVFAALALAVTACTDPGTGPAADVTAPDQQQSESALIDYLTAAAEGRWEEAAARFAGDAEILTSFAPDADPNDLPALFEMFCTVTGGVCLPVGEVSLVSAGETGTVFSVTFLEEDGSELEIGPCCGGEGAPQREFTFTVVGDGSKILELPPFRA